MYNPKEYQETKRALKTLTKALVALSLCMIILAILAVSCLLGAQEQHRIAYESERKCAAAEVEIERLNEVIDNITMEAEEE